MIPPLAPRPQTLTPDALDAWADAHDVGVSEVTPGHFYAVAVVAGVVEVRMAYGAGEAESLAVAIEARAVRAS